MGRLFRADLRKQKKSSTMWVCMILAFLFGIVMAVLYYIVWLNIGSSMEATRTMIEQMGIQQETFEDVLAQFPEPNLFEYANALLCDSNVFYIGAIVICVFVGSEYSMGTIKHSLARGYTRTKVFFSKFIVSVFSMLAVVLAYVLGGCVTSACMFGFSGPVGPTRIVMVLLAYFSLYIAASSLCMMIAVIMRKTGQAVAVAIVFPILVDSVISAITIANRDFIYISRFWILRTFVSTEELCLAHKSYIPFLVAAVYTGISLIIAYMTFRRQEIK